MATPGRLQIANSLAVICIALLMAGLSLAAWTVDSFAVLAVVPFCPLGFFVAVSQYSATFRGSVRSAARTTNCFTGLLAFSAFGFVCTFFECLLQASWDNLGLLTGLLMPIAGIVAWFAVCRALNARWRDTLRSSACPPAAPSIRSPTDSAQDEPLRGQSNVRPWNSRDALATLAAAAGVAAVAITASYDSPPREALHATPAEAELSLPPGASDVCVKRGYRGTVTYEFSIDEPGFWTWAKSGQGSIESQAAGVPIEPITAPISVRGCSCVDDESPYPEITHGWHYVWLREDRVCEFFFDADRGRVYFHFQAG